MNGSIGEFSTKKISKTLVDEIKTSLRSVTSYGSVEIFVQDNVVTQITVRNIKKTNNHHTNGNRNGDIAKSKSIVNKM